jgi:GDP-D-mannose 3',5'-epimerase
MKKALVCGAGGFIGSHLVKRLKKDGFWTRGVDLKYPPYCETAADDFIMGDLRDMAVCREAVDQTFDEVYQLAADMGGAGYVFTGENDAEVMHNSSQINLNVLEACRRRNTWRIFYSSSACIYPEHRQTSPDNPGLAESDAYPAAPDSEYGWEGAWNDGREKAPAAICRKVALASDDGEIQIWGDGEQTRSFLYIDECIEGTLRLMRSDFTEPLNIGSDEMATINQLAMMTSKIANKKIRLKHILGPLGVRGRNSDNTLIAAKLGWRPRQPLIAGLEKTCQWIDLQVRSRSNAKAPRRIGSFGAPP